MRKFAKIYLLLWYFGYNKFILILNYKNTPMGTLMANASLINNPNPQTRGMDSMGVPSPQVTELIRRIQSLIDTKPSSGSMDGPSEAVKRKLIQLGLK